MLRCKSIIDGCSENQRGVALTELAIALPILILSAMGVVDFGFELREHTVMVEASRVGARAAGMLPDGTSSSDINQTALDGARAYLQNSGYVPANYTFKINYKLSAADTQIALSGTGAPKINLIVLAIQRKSGVRMPGFGWESSRGAATSKFSLVKSNKAKSQLS